MKLKSFVLGCRGSEIKVSLDKDGTLSVERDKFVILHTQHDEITCLESIQQAISHLRPDFVLTRNEDLVIGDLYRKLGIDL